MGEKRINNRETKKKKKEDANASAYVPSSSPRPVMTQPELITKKKKPK